MTGHCALCGALVRAPLPVLVCDDCYVSALALWRNGVWDDSRFGAAFTQGEVERILGRSVTVRRFVGFTAAELRLMWKVLQEGYGSGDGFDSLINGIEAETEARGLLPWGAKRGGR